ncbi:Hsp20/alpha crystallin family protein [Caenimonas terrae]|uniref:Hsp20/alpha crystallin family protein n=1 Tax=Caenimonas terrae TaxID=696074 RepID=A0ABW0NEU9_9BURK
MNGLFRPSADLFEQLSRLQNQFDQAFFSPGTSIRALAGANFPAINVGSTPDTVEVMALAPGLDPTAIQLTIDHGLLTISGERLSTLPEPSERTGIYAQERFTGAFRRVLSLPDDIDPAKVDASYQDGVLRVTLSRRESAKPRRIEIT